MSQNIWINLNSLFQNKKILIYSIYFIRLIEWCIGATFFDENADDNDVNDELLSVDLELLVDIKLKLNDRLLSEESVDTVELIDKFLERSDLLLELNADWDDIDVLVDDGRCNDSPK